MYILRSPSSSKAEFLDRFSAVMEELLEKSQKDCTIVGDFNIDLFIEEDYYANRMKSCINRVGLKQIVMEPTRVAAYSEALIDLIITDNMNMNCKILKTPRISGHFILSMSRVLNKSRHIGEKFLMKGKLDYVKYIAKNAD